MTVSEATRRAYLDALGVTRWEPRAPAQERAGEVAPGQARSPHSAPEGTTTPDVSPPGEVGAMDWSLLTRTVAGCTRCGLHATRTQTVFGVGNREARWLFIGEAPGADEDRQGEPFVGRAGQLLNAMIEAIGLKREDVYIANVLKCRPPGNRDPQPIEVESCEPYLMRQIELIHPRLIVALGRHAAHSLLKTEAPLARLRGQRLAYRGTPLVVTFHPAYLLRSPLDKRRAWDDLCLARKIVEAAP
jgi:uracil-DNA glycosylase family 4